MPPNRYRLGNWSLLLICLSLSGIVAYEWLRPPTLAPLTKAASELPPPEPDWQIATPQQLVPADLANYREIVERPLFLEARRPPETEAPIVVVQEQIVEEEKSFTLIGVLVTSDSTAALIRDDESGTTERMRVGERIENWRLKEIHADNVVLEKNDKVQVVELKRNVTPPPPQQSQDPRIEARKRLLELQQQRREALLEQRQQRRAEIQERLNAGTEQ